MSLKGLMEPGTTDEEDCDPIQSTHSSVTTDSHPMGMRPGTLSRSSSHSSISSDFRHGSTREIKTDFSMHLFSRRAHQSQTATHVSFFLTKVSAIDTEKGTFDVDFRLVLRYQHKPLKEVPSGEWWIPDLFFANVVQFEEKMDPEFFYDNESHELTLTKHFMATFRFDIDLSHFPFDCQILSIKIKSVLAKLHRSQVVMESRKSREWLFGNPLLVADINDTDEVDSSSSISAEVPIARLPKFYLINIVLPLFLITSTSWGSFFIQASSFDTKLVIATLSILSVVMFRSATSSLLPRIPYNNDLGNYFLVCYLILFLVECLTISVSSPHLSDISFEKANLAISFVSFLLFTLYTIYFCLKAIFQRMRFKRQWLK